MNTKPVTPIRLIGRCLLFLASPALAWAQSDYSIPYSFTTLAGASSIGSTDGSRDVARFFGPKGIAVDVSGSIYVADAYNDAIRKVTPSGIVSTVAGVPGDRGSIDGPGRTARFDNPQGIALDLIGNLYVADTDNHTIRKISPGGDVSTLAGTAGVAGSADGNGAAARFNGPTDVAVDPAGNLYVADYLNHIVRKITPAGDVTTLAGSAGTFGGTDDIGSAARFNMVAGITADAAGNVYVTTETTVRKITPAGVVTTLAGIPVGSGTGVGFGSVDGTGSAARFNYPKGIAVDLAGNLYVADRNNNAIRKITTAGVATTVAGSAYARGSTDGTGSAALFVAPEGIAVDPAGNLYVADTGNNTIRKITGAGTVSTLAGLSYPQSTGSTDGTGSIARFKDGLGGAAVGPDGEVYVADTYNFTIRKITPAGVVSTLAGAAFTPGNADGPGSAARFSFPTGVAVDATGNVFVADAGGNTIRKITPAGIVATFAGTPFVRGAADGSGSTARFDHPTGVAVDSAGNVYVADASNLTIRKISPAGEVTTLAGTAGAFGGTDGTGSAARFSNVSGVATDLAGNVYVADTSNHTVRKISPAGVVTTLAGKTQEWGDADGTGGAARFSNISGIAVDSAGNVYVTDNSNMTIRRITPAGVVTTIAGLVGVTGSADGTGSVARFLFPAGVAVDASNNLFVTSGSTVRKGRLAGPPVITTQPLSLTVATGSNVQFSITASGAPAPIYQWYFNGNPFSGATSSTLSFTNARTADAGDYTVVVTNELGAVTSNRATLSVTGAAAPPPAPSSGGGGGGGGAPSAWFYLALLALGATRHLTARPPTLMR